MARIRVAAENDVSQTQYRTGEVIYGVPFPDGIVEISEPYVVRVA